MIIALDWDQTFTLDKEFWLEFVQNCILKGHDVRIVTMRSPEMEDNELKEIRKLIPVIYTSTEQKREYCVSIGWFPQIWIDDSPEFIVSRDVHRYLSVFNPPENKK
jgi:hypothetical protein